jgi:hypothetical protein
LKYEGDNNQLINTVQKKKPWQIKKTCPTKKESRDANLAFHGCTKRVYITQEERYANLTDKEKMETFVQCNGSMLLGVNTPCALGNEGRSAILTWHNNTYVTNNPYAHSATGRCKACHSVNTKNLKSTTFHHFPGFAG